MEDVELLVFQILFQVPGHMKETPLLQDPGVDALFQGLPGKGAVHKADQLHLIALAQLLQQVDDVGLRAAHVAAGDQMHDLHGITPA